MKLRSVIGNTLWALACQPAQRRLAYALQQPAEAQQRVLKRLIKRHSASVFGREHGFANLHQASDFQAHVPIHDYESLS
ncbi:MAG: GH3 auxin-responsive promoter family protein, partial [Verrucomicrobia bacterium]|nr:GH3 auxin-responsive promoter family protein [Verrucomicrobiota bacterium]